MESHTPRQEFTKIPKGSKVAIIGSRNWKHSQPILRLLKELKSRDVIIVSGGAPGADTIAEQKAVRHGIEIRIYHANWKAFGKIAGLARNHDIINNADYVFAFHDGESPGTKHALKLAREKGIPTVIKYRKEKKHGRPRKDDRGRRQQPRNVGARRRT